MALRGSLATRPKTARPVPHRSAEFLGLSLDDLRSLRAELGSEETTISYWRRIVQARIDILRTGGNDADLGRLRKVLTTTPGHAQRYAVVSTHEHESPPPLPDLAALWAIEPDDDASRASVLAELVRAEKRLSEHRSALHRRQDAATAELVARYHEDPAAALQVLPLR